MDRKRARGRQKIPLKKIQKIDDCYATFSKRKLGLFKKASELSTLCNVDIGIIMFSPTGKPYSFFHPTMELVLDPYVNPERLSHASYRLLEAHIRTRILQINEMLDKVIHKLEVEKEREKHFALMDESDTRPKGWLDGPIEELNQEQVQHSTMFLENLQVQIKKCEKEMKGKDNEKNKLCLL